MAAPSRAASRKIERNLSATMASVLGSSGSKRAHNEENLTERLTRGIGPDGDSSICGRDGHAPLLPDRSTEQIQIAVLHRHGFAIADCCLADHVQGKGRRFFALSPEKSRLSCVRLPSAMKRRAKLTTLRRTTGATIYRRAAPERHKPARRTHGPPGRNTLPSAGRFPPTIAGSAIRRQSGIKQSQRIIF